MAACNRSASAPRLQWPRLPVLSSPHLPPPPPQPACLVIDPEARRRRQQPAQDARQPAADDAAAATTAHRRGRSRTDVPPPPLPPHRPHGYLFTLLVIICRHNGIRLRRPIAKCAWDRRFSHTTNKIHKTSHTDRFP